MLEEKGKTLTALENLGEFGLINHLTASISTKNKSTSLGIGDDAAILEFNKKTLVSTDVLSRRRTF